MWAESPIRAWCCCGSAPTPSANTRNAPTRPRVSSRASVSLRDCVNLPTFDPAIPVVSVNHVSRTRSRTRSNDVRNCAVSNHFVNHVAGKPHVCHRFLWSQKSFLPRSGGRRRLFVPLLKAHVRSANTGAIYPKTRIVTRINGAGLRGTIGY